MYILSMDGLHNYVYVSDCAIQFEKEGGGDHPVAWCDGHVLLVNWIEATMQLNSIRPFNSIRRFNSIRQLYVPVTKVDGHH